MKLPVLALLVSTFGPPSALADTPPVAPRVAHAEDATGAPPAGFDEAAPTPPGLVPMRPDASAPAGVEDPILRHGKVVGSGHGMYVGSAITTPQNAFEIGVTTIPPFGGVLTLSTGITSTTELRADVGGTLEDGDNLSGFGIGIKQVIGRGRTWAFALAGSLHQIGEGRGDQETLYAVGAIATACGDADCSVMFNGGFHYLSIRDQRETIAMVTLGLSAGSKTTRFMLELVTGGANGDNVGVAFVGMRLGSRKVAVDLGLATAFAEGDGAVLPMLSLHSRL